VTIIEWVNEMPDPFGKAVCGLGWECVSINEYKLLPFELSRGERLYEKTQFVHHRLPHGRPTDFQRDFSYKLGRG